MKALSIRQPWAWAILHAGKRIENRDWRGCYYRGPLLIHAAKGCTRAEYIDARVGMIRERLIRESEGALGPQHAAVLPPLERLDRGGIVGVCDLIDAVYVDFEGHRISNDVCIGCGYRRPSVAELVAARQVPLIPRCTAKDPWACGPLGLVLADVRPLPFTPYKGALGFFDVPDELVRGAL